MALRPILVIPDDRLRTVAAPVTDITPEIVKQVEDMFETMYDAPGIGLAAVQIGIMNRVVVVDCGEKAVRDEAKATGQDVPEDIEDSSEPIAMINPEILSVSDEISVYEEGCLSIPEYYEEVERPARCRIRYTDLSGKSIERDCEGLLATCVQHEIDHLDGKLFIDYLSRLKRERVIKKFQKMARRAG